MSLPLAPPANLSRYGKSKILVIDDESANAELLEAILTDTGHENVKAITDSRIALDVCRSLEPDLILLDLTMPHVDGFTILEALHSEADGVCLPVIVLTADGSKETKLRVLNAGASDFILKPFDLTEALLRIENLLALRDRNLQLKTQRDALTVALQATTLESREAQSPLVERTTSIR